MATSAWARAEAENLLQQRNYYGCRQAGSRGPPFAATSVPPFSASVLRWLPWYWYSIDGTGWCYDVEMDEMQRCEDVGPVDWNGVTLPSDAAPPRSWAALLLVVAVASAVGACCAFCEWAEAERRRAGGRAADDELWPSVRRWARSADAKPWRWGRVPLCVLASGLLGHVVAAHWSSAER